MWRFLRNRRLILRLYYFQGIHILGASRGGPCDSVASCFCLFLGFVRFLIDYPLVDFVVRLVSEMTYNAPSGT